MSMAQGCLHYLNYEKIAADFADDTSSANARILKRADDTYLNFGLYDFAIEIMFLWDSNIANPGSDKLIIGKGRFDQAFANTGGWALVLVPSTSSLKLMINDGDTSAVSVTWTGVHPAGINNFFRIEVDRDVGAKLYKNGAFVSTGAGITTRQDSVNNSEPLLIGGYSGLSTSWLKGDLDLLRLDYGMALQDAAGAWYPIWVTTKSMGEVWNKELYLRYAHFWPQDAGHYLAAWYFNLTLEDTGHFGYDLSCYQGNGSTAATIGYNTGPFWGANYTWAFQPLPAELVDGHLDLDARLRGLDGTMKVYKGPRKRTRYMVFRTTDVEQVIALQGAWHQSSLIALRDNVNQPPVFYGYLTYPPTITEVERHGDPMTLASYLRVWEVEVEMEEA